MADIHYEIFRRAGKGGWSLVEALPSREAALENAKALLTQGATAVRVVKETFQPGTGDYLSLVVFEDGDIQVKKNKNKKTEDFDNPVPCFKPDDLYSYHARVTLIRLIGDWLARQKLTVTELLHSAAALEKFEATGTTYQHAVQKIAVAQASDSNTPVSGIIKQLNELCDAAIHRVYKDEKRGAFPACDAGKFAPLAAKLAGQPGASYTLNGALAKYLAPAKGWEDKLKRLLALMPEIAPEGLPRTFLLSSIDTLIAEMLGGNAALADLLGPNEDLGHALLNLVQLFLGRNVAPAEGAEAGACQGLNELARYFAKDELPEARNAIASRMVSELKGMKRLCPAAFDAELKMLRKLANQLVLGQGKYLSHEDLISAFTERSKRLVTHEPLAQYLSAAKSPDEKLALLLTVEENIIGAENKRTLATFIMPVLSSNGFEDQICNPAAQPLQRLKRLAELQTRALRAGFQDIQKGQIAAALDQAALHIEDRAKILASIEAKFPNPVNRAEAVLKLQAAGIFTQGDLSMKARRMLMAAIGKQGFFTGYIANRKAENPEAGREAVLADLIEQLAKFGIDADESKRAIAA